MVYGEIAPLYRKGTTLLKRIDGLDLADLAPKSIEIERFRPFSGYPELENVGVSEGVLGSIFRVASRLERCCIALSIRPPHR